ncbi:MAG: hypothetical protein COB09_05795 [Thalassobium sp.]|jgi:hypothetical protein|uniref:Uncharacterized protein n=2 Tax=root TaxID=1 RepID=M5DWE3_9GAMM|nr:hypothetical protein [Thalassolituus oleivorans]AHK17887.1 hypothetical protein R615_15855 [Thalassolituus oleivorans R6-15]MAK89740.1 hypothetical protein [Thalassolituus sp.]PHS65277.1 MAG: hypothetical protein COB09_05795 [Thalassobium sp.]CCU73773.1 hypothetical protein TOL_3383 [Thalassolituus oleivorans MIL-1]|tara:strand:- start:18406 stop:20442 length:2037 start_codon:yes stop_codon:yes gene_type:complete
MNEFFDLFNDRPEQYSQFEAASLSLSELGRIRFNFKSSSQNYKQIYAGRVLFNVRNIASIKTRTKCSPTSLDSWDIDFSSYINHRKIYLIRLIDSFLDGTAKRGSITYQLNFIDWADNRYERDKLFFDKEQMKRAYSEYSNLLWDRVSQSNLSSPFSRSTARMCQEGAAQAILLTHHDLEYDKLQSWALRIQQRRGEKGFKVLESTQRAALSRDAHRYLFNKISEYLLQDDHPKPFILKPEPKLGITGQIYLSSSHWNLHGINNNPASYFYRSGTLGRSRIHELLYDRSGKISRSINELMESKDAEIKKNGPFSDKKFHYRLREHYHAIISSDNSGAIEHESYHRDLFNIASVHFSHLILADSGTNLAVLLTAPMIEPTNLEREGKFRILSFKSKGDKQYSLRLSPLAKKYWSRYVALCQKFIPSDSPLKGPQHFKQRQSLSHTISSKQLIIPTKFWNSVNLWVSTKDWRDYSVNLALTVTGDIHYSANQHQHTVETSRKHYIAVENRVAVKELNGFFSGLASAVNLYKSKRVAVNIVGENVGTQGLTGICISQGEAKEGGFSDEAPSPRCSAMLSCFFCKSYALRAREEDVLMLLSIQKWLPLHSRENSLNMDEHLLKFQPVIERIDDIIADLSNKGEQYENIVKRARRLAEIGNLHPYWDMKIAALKEITSSRGEQ